MALLEGQTESFMQPPEILLDGDPLVLQNIIIRKILIDAGLMKEASEIRPVALFTGGGQAGVSEAGMADAFAALDLFPTGFSAVVGISAGAPIMAYLAAGQPEAAAIFYEANPENGFISISNLLKSIPGQDRRGLVNFIALEKEFRTGKFALDVEKMRKCPIPLLVGITVTEDTVGKEECGSVKYIDIRFVDDPIQIIMASVLMPILGNIAHVTIDGIGYNDGAVAAPIPWELIRRLDPPPTDVLMFVNSPHDFSKPDPTWKETIDETVANFAQRVGGPIVKAIITQPQQFRRMYETLFLKKDLNLPRIAALSPAKNTLGVFEGLLCVDASRLEMRYLRNAEETMRRLTATMEAIAEEQVQNIDEQLVS